MVRKKKISWRPIITAAIITVIVFSVGIALGYTISKMKIDILESGVKDFQIQQKDTEVELFLLNTMGEDSCDIIQYELEKTTELASRLGSELTLYDTRENIKNPKLIEIKKAYSLALIQHWSYWNLFNERC